MSTQLLDFASEVAQFEENKSFWEYVESLPEEQQLELDSMVQSLLPHEQLLAQHGWAFNGRPKQMAPDWCRSANCGCNGAWTLWLLLAGRGFGKTRVGAEWVHEMAFKFPGCRIAVIAPTANSARSVMIDGVSGILATEKPWNKCHYEPSKLQITWANGSHAGVFSADEPNRLRGPQHHFVWADEICAWPKVIENWNMMKFGLRLPAKAGWAGGYRPRIVVTTTPIATEFIRKLAGHAPFKKDRRTHITTGSTYENKSNLDADYFESVVKDLEGTRLGRQELNGEILADIPGALWKAHMIDPYRIDPEQLPDAMKNTVVAIDPSAGGDNATGIIVCSSGPPPGGKIADIQERHTSVAESLRKVQRTHGYVIADVSSAEHNTPDKWARAAVRAYHEYGASMIVAESNQGGDMIKYTLGTVDPTIPVKLVHAQRNKQTRAEPIVALFEQGRIHVVGRLPKLEEELLTWDPELSKSPDRLDAMVWALHYLLGKGKIRHVAPPQGVGTRANPWSIFPREAA